MSEYEKLIAELRFASFDPKETVSRSQLKDLLAQAAAALEGLMGELERRDAVAREAWGDQEDEHSSAITAAHPSYTKDHDTFAKALAMVGKRHGKYELVGLVNWLLARATAAEASLLEVQVKMKASGADIAAAGPAACAANEAPSQSEGERLQAWEAFGRKMLSADREALANHRPKWGVADCVDNAGVPYQSQWFADALTDARALLGLPALNPDRGMKP